MSPYVRALPNAFSLLRLLLVPVLWVLALRGETQWVGIGLLVAGLTDMIDGRLARQLGVVSRAGARLDSVADNLIALSGVVWLVLLRPDVIERHFALLLSWLVLYLAFLAVGLVKFRRFGNLHLWSAKIAAVFQYAFLVHCMLFSGIPSGLFHVTAAISIASLMEGLAYELLSSRVHEHAGSLLLLLGRRERHA